MVKWFTICQKLKLVRCFGVHIYIIIATASLMISDAIRLYQHQPIFSWHWQMSVIKVIRMMVGKSSWRVNPNLGKKALANWGWVVSWSFPFLSHMRGENAINLNSRLLLLSFFFNEPTIKSITSTGNKSFNYFKRKESFGYARF